MTLTHHLHAAQIIASRHPIRPPATTTPRNKTDIARLAEWDRAVAAWAVVRVLELRLRGEEEGRRT